MEWWINGRFWASSSFPLLLLRLLPLPNRSCDSWPSTCSGTWMYWFSSQLLHTQMITSLLRVDGSWPDEANRAMSSAKCKDLILDSLNRNSVREAYDPKLSAGSPGGVQTYYKWIRLTAGNADQALTPGVQRPNSLNPGVWPHILPPPQESLTWSNAISKSTEHIQTGWRTSLASSRTMLRSLPDKIYFLLLNPRFTCPADPPLPTPWIDMTREAGTFCLVHLHKFRGHTDLVWPLIFLFLIYFTLSPSSDSSHVPFFTSPLSPWRPCVSTHGSQSLSANELELLNI